MKILQKFLVRILIAGVPLIGLYFYSKIAFEANTKREHPTDVGLGIGFLLFAILVLMSFGFIVDFIIRIKNKQYETSLINIPFLIIFSFPILYIKCQMSSYCKDCFCSWIIEIIKKL